MVIIKYVKYFDINIMQWIVQEENNEFGNNDVEIIDLHFHNPLHVFSDQTWGIVHSC